MKNFIKAIISPLIGGVVIVLSILGVQIIMSTGLWQFVVFAFVGALAYFSAIYLLDKLFDFKIQEHIKGSLQSFGDI